MTEQLADVNQASQQPVVGRKRRPRTRGNKKRRDKSKNKNSTERDQDADQDHDEESDSDEEEELEKEPTPAEPVVKSEERKAKEKARRQRRWEHKKQALIADMADAEPAASETSTSTPSTLAPPHLESMSAPTTPSKGTRNVTPLSPLVQQGEQIEDNAANSESESAPVLHCPAPTRTSLTPIADAEARLARQKQQHEAEKEAWYNDLAESRNRIDELEQAAAKAKTDYAKLQVALRDTLRERDNMRNSVDRLSTDRSAFNKREEDAARRIRAQDAAIEIHKRDIAHLNSQVTDQQEAATKQGEELDFANAMKDTLNSQLDDANKQLQILDAVKEENGELINQWDHFNERLEEIFEEIGSSLSVDERLARLRDLKSSSMMRSDSTSEMHALTPGSRRSISGATLEDDMAGVDDSGSETDVEDPESPGSSKITSQDTTQHVPEPQIIIKEVPAEPEIIIKHVPETRYVHMPITTNAALAALSPWLWVGAMLLLLVVAAWSGALAREKAVWRAANSLTYDRLMGQSAETWVEWVVLGVERMVGVDRSVYG